MKRLIILILFCFVSLYSANIPDYEIRPHVSGVAFENEHYLEDGHVYGFDFAKGLNDDFMVSLSLNMSTFDYNSDNIPSDYYLLTLNGEYYYYENGAIQSYLTAGFSYVDLFEDVQGASSMPGFNYGVGAKYLINEDAGLYAEIRHLTTFKKYENQFVYTFGVLIPFGYEPESKPKAPPLEELAMEEAPPVEMLLLPNDDDRDGVVNAKDKCPDSNLMYEVDEDGCTIQYTLHVKFAFDSSKLKGNSMKIIKDFSIFMDEPKKLNIEIHGHTDSTGSVAYNEKLSLRQS